MTFHHSSFRGKQTTTGPNHCFELATFKSTAIKQNLTLVFDSKGE